MNIPSIYISTKDFKKHISEIEQEYWSMTDKQKDSPKGDAIRTLYELRDNTGVKFLGADFIVISTLDPYDYTNHYKALIKWLDSNDVKYALSH